jgi:acyl carrier protein
MNERATYETLNGIFKKVFPHFDGALEPHLTADDVKEWDSIHHVMLLMAIEEHFGIEFDTTEVTSSSSIEDLVKLIESKRAPIDPGAFSK